MLFNQLGTPNISTNHIAIELDISPGNLYYHYQNKAQLVEHLFNKYEEELQPLLKQAFNEELNLEDVWFFLHFSFELSVQYRFIYRDTDYILLKSPTLALKFKLVLEKLNNSLLNQLKQLAQTGILTTTSDPVLEDTAMNMLIVCTQWIQFKQHLTGTQEINITSHELSQGVYQTLSLLLPYLDQANRAHLYTLREDYK